MFTWRLSVVVLTLTSFGACAADIHPTVTPEVAASRMSELWKLPADIANADLLNGPWGADSAPDPQETYTFVRPKEHGANPGMTVNDSHGREWHIKQGREAQPEVFLSHVLSAVGYHQPPVYYLRSFTLVDDSGRHTAEGGRFRLHGGILKNGGEWSWDQNPFVGTPAYQGLLVMLVLFNSADLKNDNNSIFEVKRKGKSERRASDERASTQRPSTERPFDGRASDRPTSAEPASVGPTSGGPDSWYVVRDLGTSLGATGRYDPPPNKPDVYETHRFITGVSHGYVEFDYHAIHKNLVQRRIRPQDVVWACRLLSELTDKQWHDAFAGAGYAPDVADRFIRRIYQKIEEGQRVARSVQAPAASPEGAR